VDSKLREALAPIVEEAVDLRMLLHVAQEELPSVFGLRTGILWVHDGARRKFLGPRDFGLEAPDGFRDELLAKGQHLESPLWAPDRAAADPAFSSLFDPSVKSFLLLPVREGKTAIGLLAFASPDPVTGDGVPALAAEAAPLLAGALRRAEAQFRLQEDFKLQQSLLDLVKQMASEANLVSFCQRAFRIVERLVPVDAMFIALRRDDGLYDALLETDLDDRNRRIFYPVPRLMEPGRSRVLETIDQHSYVLINRSEEELRELEQGSRPDQPQHLVGNPQRRSASLLYVPVWSGEDFTGVLSVQSYALNAYRHEDARRLLVVSDYLGLAFRLARRADGRP
jgi:hypothetical protein